ncbi:MAG: leucyl/phenylalanyl-tRNA--protein transferase [Alphaproteobacteria bacterium]|jgi:leucyl/phenylalanyl-tRNA---protein transferase|nr:leucyl/phenylalanyl-tRNA--protein transferase [Alphaproteobacteria bacterium]MBT4019272.1 leucyl/phenylalanyl-tRNA--protein transferase [Alphaproteobacteria bacterium]MBT4966523.1 leucyl/phenylalanyl-tRNA--protein transferase [Alphaproteobacteria bacterium]MBT5159922.1 leucyl/phenylalanyl-tRNA--protein transferase [Alphaproteobacteria bacterium]MBT6386685.1 leucyl/phenylalanyl-tRNA--protein transferase [Alphaproteobacteria bacterium]
MTAEIILTPDLVLQAYAIGVFPMADGREDDHIFWVDPDKRGILPLDKFHVSKRLRKTVRNDHFVVTVDTDFKGVMEACAEDTPRRSSTWINDEIIDLYVALFKRGYAHSVECYLLEDGKRTLVGGLYGVSMGGAFFGESMFTRVRDASKVALVHLVGRLNAGGYQLLDTQFVTDHLAGFGAIEIPRDVYQVRLQKALEKAANFYSTPAEVDGSSILQSITQTS